MVVFLLEIYSCYSLYVVSVHISSKDSSQTRLRHTRLTSLIYITVNSSISNSSHIQKYWELCRQHRFGGLEKKPEHDTGFCTTYYSFSYGFSSSTAVIAISMHQASLVLNQISSPFLLFSVCFPHQFLLFFLYSVIRGTNDKKVESLCFFHIISYTFTSSRSS